MPEVGAHSPPRAPSTLSLRGASSAEHAGPMGHPGTPARASAARTVTRGMWSKALRQPSAAPAMKRP
eukprot:9668376-Lingulodinium_polyedra.AAC.1